MNDAVEASEVEVSEATEASTETTEQTTEQTAEQTQEAAHWLADHGGDEDLQKFVGGRDPIALANYARSLRQAQSSQEGMLKLPEEGQRVDGDTFKALRPDTIDAYASIVGKKDEDVTPQDRIEMEAAHAANLHKDQYRALVEGRRDAEADAAQATSQEVVSGLQKEWGPEYEGNVQSIERAAKALGQEFVDAVSQPGLNITAEGQKAFMSQMLKLGQFMTEGGPINGGSTTSAQTFEEERSNLEHVASERSLSPSEKARLDQLNIKIAEERVNG